MSENSDSQAAQSPAVGASGGIGAPVEHSLTAERQGEGMPTPDDKTWGLIAHISALASLLGIPFGNIVGPLVVYLAKKDQSQFVHFHALQSLIFQIAFTVGIMALAIPVVVLVLLSGGLLIFPFIGLTALLSVLMLAYVVVMGIKANEGKWSLYVIAGNIAYEKVYKPVQR